MTTSEQQDAIRAVFGPAWGGQLIGPGSSQPELTEDDKANMVKVLEHVITDPTTGGRKGQKLAQFSQIPPDVLLELAEHYGKGVAKYPDSEDGEPNWQRGYSWRLSVDALGRHLLAWLSGEDTDPDSGSNHLTAVMWHAMALRWFQLHGKGLDYR